MQILYSPQVPTGTKVLKYSFQDDAVHAEFTCGDISVSDIFDFAGLPDGHMEIYADDGTCNIDTVLPVLPICKVWKEDGELYVVLLKYIDEDATEEEKFPDWQVV